MAELNDFEATFVNFQYVEKTGTSKNALSALIDDILTDLQLKKSEKRRVCVANYISSVLLTNYGCNRYNRVIFPQTADYYGDRGLFNQHFDNFSGYPHKINSDIVKGLIKQDYLVLGDSRTGNKKANIISAQPKLIQLIEQHGVSLLSFSKHVNKADLLKIRHADADLDQSVMDQHKIQLQQYNRLLDQADIRVGAKALSSSHKDYYRSFTNVLYKQGHFYSTFCHLSDAQRQTVRINQQPTVLVKINASWLLLAYAYQQKDLTMYPFSSFELTLEGEQLDEQLNEMLLTAFINYKKASLAAKAVLPQLAAYAEFAHLSHEQSLNKAVAIIDALVEKHDAINMQTLSANVLAFQESCINERMVGYALEHKIPLLVAHDVFVFPSKDESALSEHLKRCICDVAKMPFEKPQQLIRYL